MQKDQKSKNEYVQFEQNWQNIRVRKDILKALEPIAEAEERSVTQQINWILKQEIEKSKVKK